MRKSSRLLFLICVTGLLMVCAMSTTGCGKKEKEFVAEGETTMIENPTKDPSEYTANQQLYILAAKLKTVNSYRSTIVGQTESKMPKYVQHIDDIHIKSGDESYSEAKSTSFLVNVGKQAYFKGDKVVCREAEDVKKGEWSNDLSVTTLDNYRSKIGNEATALSSYILNDESILKAESEKLSNGDYKITVDIDPVKGTSRYKVKMMNYGGLKSEPQFISCGFTITFNSNWEPMILIAHDDYKIEKGILNLHCNSEITETFKDFGKEISIPNAQKYRDKIGDDASNLDDEKEIEGNTLLFNTILQMDTSKGIKINGTVDADIAGKTIILPVDGWMTFDFENYAKEDTTLNDVFTGRVSTTFNNIPINIYYVGDGWLYINIGDTKYKYSLLADDGSDVELDDMLSSIIIEEGERIDNFRHFNIKLQPVLINYLNAIVSEFANSLPINFGDLRNLKVNDLHMGVTLVKKSPSLARITEVTMDGDFGAALGHAEVLVAEKPETLPNEEELNKYQEAEWDNLIANFKFITNMLKGFGNYNWSNGVSFNLNAGLHSDENDEANLLFTFAMEGQKSANGFKAHLTFGLGALMGLPGEIYLENGTIYLVTTVTENKVVYPAKVEIINLVEELVKLIPSLQGKSINLDNILSALANLALNSKVVTTKVNENTDRVELYLCKDAVTVINKLYNALIDKVKGLDMGSMGALVSQLITLFQFNLDDVIIRTDFVDKKLSSFSLRLKNNETSLAGAGKDLSFVLELDKFANLEEGVFDEHFAIIANGLKAMEESKDVRAMIDKIVDNGITYLGESMFTVLQNAINEFNSLSVEAQKTVVNYKEFVNLVTEFTNLHNQCIDFIEGLEQIDALAKEGNKDKEIYDILNTVLNPIYNNIDYRQTEFIGTYAINRYLAYRDNNEKNYQVQLIIGKINELTVENYPTSKDLTNAINAVNNMYLALSEENRALVTNYDKVAAAKAVAHTLELNEFNAEMLTYTETLSKINDESDYATLKKEKTNAENMLTKYNGLADEDKAAITNFAAFKAAYDKLFGIIDKRFINAYNAIGGIDNVKAGDECYNLIDNANQYQFILNADLRAKYKNQITDLSKCSTAHRNIETKAVDDLILAIGEVTFTKECHDKIVAARTALEGIRSKYTNSVSKRNTLRDAEVQYVLLSIGDLTVETVTKDDATVVANARIAYDEVCGSYTKMAFFRNGIINKLATFKTTLEAMEAKIK